MDKAIFSIALRMFYLYEVLGYVVDSFCVHASAYVQGTTPYGHD